MPATDALVAALDRVIEALPKEGLKAAKAVSIVSRIRQLAENVSTAAAKAECLAKARGRVIERGGASLYDTGCARIEVVVEDGKVVVSKVGSHAFTAVISNGTLRVEDKKVGLETDGRSVTLRLVAGEGKDSIEVPLSDVNSIFRGYYHLAYVMKELEGHVRVTLEDLDSCARRQAIQC